MRRPTALIVCVVLLAGALAVGAGGASGKSGGGGGLRDSVFASGTAIFHTTSAGREAISKPDDITSLGGDIFVGFQNGVGPQGQASTTGNLDSTVVEFNRAGKKLAQWDVLGKCDGLTADPQTGRVIATVNEDLNSSLYLIKPGGAAVHYRYAKRPSHNGGTDAISIYQGKVLISASAPGTTGAPAPQAKYPAVYVATFDNAKHSVSLRSLFGDGARATLANSGKHGKSVRLALTDPDSSEDVPSSARRFAGDFMLTSQGDDEQIFVSGAGGRHQSLSVLKLSTSVDDTAWPTGSGGTLYATDNGNDTIYKITGGFARGAELTAGTPCNDNSAPTTCPAPGFPANFVGEINPFSGAVSPVHVTGPAIQPQGLLYVP